MTPKRPEATCLIAERFESPLGSGLNRSGSSPPSPVLLLPPRRFMAMASVSWASAEIEPKLIAPVQNRLTISFAGSTSSIGIGPPFAPGLNVEQAAQRTARLRIAVRVLGEPAVGIAAVVARGDLQIGNRRRVPHVPLAVGPPVELARVRQHGQPIDRPARDSRARAAAAIPRPARRNRRLECGWRCRRSSGRSRRLEADGLENLRALVALQRRDAHLGHHFEHALGDALAIRRRRGRDLPS